MFHFPNRNKVNISIGPGSTTKITSNDEILSTEIIYHPSDTTTTHQNINFVSPPWTFASNEITPKIILYRPETPAGTSERIAEILRENSNK